jgi:hypothetical protein
MIGIRPTQDMADDQSGRNIRTFKLGTGSLLGEAECGR